MKTILALFVIAGTAFPVRAEEIYQRPESCLLNATVQFDDCTVDNLYRCAPNGDQAFRRESFSQDGQDGIGTMDENHAETAFADPDGGGIDLIVVRSTHPREVLAKGTGKIEWTGTISMFGITRPMSATAQMTAAGQQRSVSGHDLHIYSGDFVFVLPPPMPPTPMQVVFGYDKQADILVELEIIELDGSKKKIARLSLAGEAGFGSEIPEFGCQTLSLFDRTQAEMAL